MIFRPSCLLTRCGTIQFVTVRTLGVFGSVLALVAVLQRMFESLQLRRYEAREARDLRGECGQRCQTVRADVTVVRVLRRLVLRSPSATLTSGAITCGNSVNRS